MRSSRAPRRPLAESLRPPTGLRPQRPDRAGRQLFHHPARAGHGGRALQCHRCIVCGQRTHCDVQPLVLAAQWRTRQLGPTRRVLRRDGQRARYGCGAPTLIPSRCGSPASTRRRSTSSPSRLRPHRRATSSTARRSNPTGRSATCSAGRTISSTSPIRRRRRRRRLFVARVPLGRFDLQPTYWNGVGWVASRAAAVAISTRPARCHQPDATEADRRDVDLGGQGRRLERQRRCASMSLRQPQGPWTTVQTVTVPTRTLDGRTNTYAAHLLPWRSDTGNLVVAISNNAWQMDPLALDNPTLYQPRLFELAAPTGLAIRTSQRRRREPLGFVPTSPPIRAIDTRRTARGWQAPMSLRVDRGRDRARRHPRRGDRSRGGRPERVTAT